MRCDLYERGRCRSCTQITVPYTEQLAHKLHSAQDALSRWSDIAWQPAVASAESGFRNKAKMVVSGRAGNVTLGILNEQLEGVDLTACGLYPAALSRAFAPTKAFVDALGIEPYAVARRRGELKHLLFTVAEPAGRLLLRFVLRSHGDLPRIREDLPKLLAALPELDLVSANLQPEHKAIIEGDEEILLFGGPSLKLMLGQIPLQLRPRSFFQTNTKVAAALYRQAAAWTNELKPGSVLDLFCGAGGFALHVAAEGRRVLGVETSVDAIESAEQTRLSLGLRDVQFEAMDALAFVESAPRLCELVIVNPPRRGLGSVLANRLDASAARSVLYSSCNVNSLARDIEAMPGFAPSRAQIFDMFPHTEHFEILVQLDRLSRLQG